MTTLSLLCLAACLASDPAATAKFEFHDAAACDGRSVLHYRTIEFRQSPPRPLARDFQPGKGALSGLVPVGPVPEAALSIVWLPNAAGGPEIWLDSNGDGRFTPDERHVMKDKQMEIRAAIAVQWKPAPQWVQRTLIFRRSSLDDGLRYAVRGYAAGTIDLGGTKHAAVLIDGNADGLFNTVGQDRIWIDLDHDRRFDLLTEQFPLGKPLTVAGQTFVVSSDATGSAVVARVRSGVEGKIRLQMAAGAPAKPSKVRAELVSDLGELLAIDQIGKPVVVTAGDYYVSSLALEVPDGTGKTWSYSFFQDEKAKTFPVGAKQEKTIALLEGLTMEVKLREGNDPVRPAETVSITPHVTAGGPLFLRSCEVSSEGASRSAETAAEILLLSPGGKVVSRGMSGFS